MFYRGIKYNPENITKGNPLKKGIYRGVEWSNETVESTKAPKSGTYRGKTKGRESSDSLSSVLFFFYSYLFTD